MNRLKYILFNGCIALNALLLVIAVFQDSVEVPAWLQVGGRLHPMLLHFPITLVVVFILWESFITNISIKEKYQIGDWLLIGAASLAVITALMGVLLSKESGYDPEAIALHKWMGIMVAVVSTLWYALRNQLRKKIFGVRMSGFILLGALILAGHEGAVITHGQGFIFEPVQSSANEKALLEDAFLYADVVRPIFEEKCYGCHNEKKAKGGLIMNPVQNLVKGGDNGILWDTLDAELGLLMHHLNLPEEDDVHMPPKGKPQLSEREKRLVYFWIKGGSDFESKVIALPESDTLRTLAASFLQTIESHSYTFDPADEDVIAGLNSDYRLVEPVALNSPALHAEFFGSAFFKSDQLNDLFSVQEQIISLNLNRMPVVDEDLKVIGKLKNLRRLNLSGTGITGTTLSELTSLQELRQLSITGTSVTVETLEVLGSLKKLATVYVWDTQLTKNEIENLRRQWPSVQVEGGFTGESVIAKLSPPQLVNGEEVFTRQTSVQLKHFVNGAVIRYTLDGTDPDSTQSFQYSGNDIIIDEPLELRARAYLKGWISSDVVSHLFFKSGYQPDSFRLITLPNPQYVGKGAVTLFDSRKGTSNFKTPQWLGYRERTFEMDLLFDDPVSLSSVTFSCLIDLNSYIFPPTHFEVWSTDENGKKYLLADLRPEQHTALEPAFLTSFILKFPTVRISSLRFIVKPVGRLPDWHPGKGDKGWVFMDEVFLN